MENTRQGPNILTDVKRLVVVLQDVVKHSPPFESYADLAEAFKSKCGRLKLRYNADLISQAIDRIEEGGKKPVIQTRLPKRVTDNLRSDPEIISRGLAVKICRELKITIPEVPPAEWTDHEEIARKEEEARQRAFEMGIEL